MTYHKKACEIAQSVLSDSNAKTDLQWSVAAKLPCRTTGPHCQHAACRPDESYCTPANCPRQNCGAETCPGWTGRRKLVLQLPMRFSATGAHGDSDIRRRILGTLDTWGTRQASCHASTVHVRTTHMRMIEWQGLPFIREGNLDCAAEGEQVSCPEGYVRDTLMRQWEHRHAANTSNATKQIGRGDAVASD